mgnify:CR=1 FL=1
MRVTRQKRNSTQRSKRETPVSRKRAISMPSEPTRASRSTEHVNAKSSNFDDLAEALPQDIPRGEEIEGVISMLGEMDVDSVESLAEASVAKEAEEKASREAEAKRLKMEQEQRALEEAKEKRRAEEARMRREEEERQRKADEERRAREEAERRRKAARRRMERQVYQTHGTLIATDFLVNSGGVIFAAHERLILANLATSLFEHGSITTTEAKARPSQRTPPPVTVTCALSWTLR